MSEINAPVTAITAINTPLAWVRGEPLQALPKDLYIPPDALAVFLEAFEGPLDLLLYLIRRQNMDISEIPIATITEQYMTYVELMKDINLDLAAEYLVMAAMLAEIKSRALLPQPEVVAEEEEDPRAQLIQRLQEYEQCKIAAQYLQSLPRFAETHWRASVASEAVTPVVQPPEVELTALLQAFQEVWQRAAMHSHHEIKREQLSIRVRMSQLLSCLQQQPLVAFQDLFTPEEGRRGIVVTLMAILELLKAQLIDIKQDNTPYAPLYIRTANT